MNIASVPTFVPSSPMTRIAAIRESNRLRRLARGERHLLDFYAEHNLTDAARAMRAVMLGHLQGACQQWRTVLGLSS